MLQATPISPQANRIQLLDNRLANQIAAGEVVERPASVVKELIENSIDSGATIIEVEIERGGTRLIRVTDDGKGIHQDDLALSLTRHATSKIKTERDLGCIQSLGFRGEALASISAVSKLVLTSRRHDSELAWQAIASGRDMAVEIQPASATNGTRIEVADLFFNTPARQKFLKAEKTEFSHIEDVFKRHALANFSIGFVLKHNHKIIKRVPACGESSQYLKRLSNIVGKAFTENCIKFECLHQSVQLYGWLGKPSFHRSESDIQFVFINGRPVKDKTLNHAIRQAYQGLLPAGRVAAYIIFLTINPAEVDVNVHPTKHEVRFSEQRLVHDLLLKSISDALIQDENMPATGAIENNHSDKLLSRNDDEPTISVDAKKDNSNINVSNTNQVGSSNYRRFNSSQFTRYSRQVNEGSFGKKSLESVITYDKTDIENNPAASPLFIRVADQYWLVELNGECIVIDARRLVKAYFIRLIKQKTPAESKALLFPKAISVNTDLLEDAGIHEWLNWLGFVYEPILGKASDKAALIFKKIPQWLTHKPTQWIFDWLTQLFQQPIIDDLRLIEILIQGCDFSSIDFSQYIFGKMQSEPQYYDCWRTINTQTIDALFK